jgi:hypothetical protein
MLKAHALHILILVALTGPPYAFASGQDPVNYDDPNLIMTNDFAGDAATTCPKNLKGKELDDCLERLGLKSSEIAQVHVLDDAVPPRARRTRSAR